MANLTSLYCNKHLTVIINVHVSPVLESQPVHPSWGKDGCGCDSSPQWHLLGSHVPLTLRWLDRAVLVKANMWRAFTVLLGSTLLLISAGKKKEEMDNKGSRQRSVLWSTRNYTGQVKKKIQCSFTHLEIWFRSFWVILTLEWPKQSGGLLPSQRYYGGWG